MRPIVICRWSSVVCLDCLSRSQALRKRLNRSRCRWVVDSDGPNYMYWMWILTSPGEYDWTVRVRRRWGLLWNYCDHLTCTCGALSTPMQLCTPLTVQSINRFTVWWPLTHWSSVKGGQSRTITIVRWFCFFNSAVSTNQTSRRSWSHSTAGLCVRALATRLLQLCSDSSSSVHYGATSASTQRRRPPHDLSSAWNFLTL